MAIDGERVAWQDRYFIQQLPSSITLNTTVIPGTRVCPVFDPVKPTGVNAIGNIGIYGNPDIDHSGRFLMKLTDHPNFPPVSGTVDTPLTIGTAERNNLEYIQTISEPGTVTLNMQAHVYNLSLFLYSLLQSGYQEDEFPTVLTNHKVFGRCLPYEIPDFDVFLGMMRLLQRVGAADNDRSSHVALGGACTSITFAGETGGIMTLAAEVQTGEVAIANRPGRAQNNSRIMIRPIPTDALDNAVIGMEYFHANAWAAFANGDVGVVANAAAFTDLTLAANPTVEVAGDTGELNIGPAAQVGEPLQHVMFPGDGTQVGKVGGVQAYANQRFEQEPPLLFQDATIWMGPYDTADASLTQVFIPGFTLTLANNATPYFYDEPFIQKWLLGQLTGEGSITIPWGTPIAESNQNISEANKAIENFRQGIVTKLIIFWGDEPLEDMTAIGDIAGIEDNYRLNTLNLKMHVRYSEATIEGDTELGTTLPFSVVSVFDETYPTGAYTDRPAIEIQMIYRDTKLERGSGEIQGYSPFTHVDIYP